MAWDDLLVSKDLFEALAASQLTSKALPGQQVPPDLLSLTRIAVAKRHVESLLTASWAGGMEDYLDLVGEGEDLFDLMVADPALTARLEELIALSVLRDYVLSKRNTGDPTDILAANAATLGNRLDEAVASFERYARRRLERRYVPAKREIELRTGVIARAAHYGTL